MRVQLHPLTLSFPFGKHLTKNFHFEIYERIIGNNFTSAASIGRLTIEKLKIRKILILFNALSCFQCNIRCKNVQDVNFLS